MHEKIWKKLFLFVLFSLFSSTQFSSAFVTKIVLFYKSFAFYFLFQLMFPPQAF